MALNVGTHHRQTLRPWGTPSPWTRGRSRTRNTFCTSRSWRFYWRNACISSQLFRAQSRPPRRTGGRRGWGRRGWGTSTLWGGGGTTGWAAGQKKRLLPNVTSNWRIQQVASAIQNAEMIIDYDRRRKFLAYQFRTSSKDDWLISGLISDDSVGRPGSYSVHRQAGQLAHFLSLASMVLGNCNCCNRLKKGKCVLQIVIYIFSEEKKGLQFSLGLSFMVCL